MRPRTRRRVDWDEELNKTERIRRKGLFVSVLGFGVAMIVIFGAGRLSESGVVLSRKVIFTFCFLLVMFLVRGVLARRARLRRERAEREEDMALSQLLERQRKETADK
jgi:hypothetical protein